MQKIVILFVCFFPILGTAETIKLLSIPLSEDQRFDYEVNAPEACSFKGVTHVEHPDFEKGFKGKAFLTILQNTQRQINLRLARQAVAPDRVSFALSGAENILFEFSYEDCKLIKKVRLGGESHELNSIRVDYTDTLKTPVLNKITIVTNDEEKPEINIYQSALRGHIPAYSLEAGPGIQVRSNYRYKDQTSFHKDDPAIGPIGVFAFQYGPVFINRSGAGSLVFNHNDLSVVAMGLVEGEPYKGDQLEERESTIYFGSIVKYRIFNLTYYKDFFHEKGYNLKLTVAPEYYYKTSWKFTPKAFLQFWDNKYVDAYYGVRAHEVTRSGLPFYQGTSTFNYGSILEISRYLGRLTFITELSYKKYGKQVYSSPTVVKKNEAKILSGFMFKFF